eukprot:g3019.t1
MESKEASSPKVHPSHTVKVHDPQTRSGWMGMKKYVTYRVIVTIGSADALQTFDIRRRYSDFEWLRLRLLKRYAGMWIPAMPGKNLEGIVGAQLGRSQSDFIEARMKGLRTFLDRVLDSPYLKDDVSVTDFLSQQSDSGWSSAKKKQAPERPVPSDSTRNGDTGIAKWLDKIGNLKVPDGPSLKVQNMEKHVSVLKGLYTELNQHLSKSVHNTESVDGKISKLVEALEKVIVNLKIDEERFSKFENGDAEVDEVSSKIITRTEEVMKAWSSCVRENKDQLAEFVKRPMDDLCLQIESVHDMLKSHQLAVNRYTVAWKSKDHYDFEMKKAEDTGRADKLASLKAKQTAAMDNLTNMRAQMDHESTSVLRSELPRFGLWSLESQRIAFAQYAKAQAASAEKEEKIWADFLKSNGADQEEMQALGQKILASSIYGPNAEPVFPTYQGFEGFITPSPGVTTPTTSDVSTKDDDTKDDEGEPESPARPPRPSRNKRNSTEEEIAVATPVEKSRKPSVEGDSGMFFNPEEDGGGDDDEEDDGIFI